MNEAQIQNFWQNHPCGEAFIGGLEKYGEDYESFFASYDEFRYRKEGHILECLDRIDFRGKRTLEIGLGQGADAEQIIRRGADWFGIDLTRESVERTNLRIGLRKLKAGGVTQGSAVEMPFAAESFDIVFSHGVLHHIPEIKKAAAEIRRIIKPDGELIVMLYAKNSLNYRASIAFLRRLALLGLYLTGYRGSGNTAQHLENARRQGILEYLKMKNFIHRNTDGALNPYSKVYDLKSVAADFPGFEIVRSYKRFMHAPPLPVGRLPFENLLGWHLWVHLKPKASGQS
ncbi:MAG: class I SAM-dependent methyltransferase [Acidobacteria bacterium]|nr:class I SAM-dependent methyltransferase [Acidobacteriota bacterium]